MQVRAAITRLAPALVLGCGIGASGGFAAQEQKNPYTGDQKSIEQGMHRYRGQCAVCHGLDAHGYRAPDMTTGDFLHGSTDAELFRVIRRGIPGTEMPPTNMHEDEIWMVIAYMRTLMTAGSSGEPRGDAANGARLYESLGCGDCHFLNGKGGRFGPDLSRIGAARSRAALIREIRTPSEYIAPGYEPVTIVTRSGEKIQGCRRNEDTFSIQLMTANEELLTFMKSDLREVVEEKRSLMPEYEPKRLTDAELDDLVRYLSTLRGSPAPASRE